MLDNLLYDLAERIVGKNGRAIVDTLKKKRDVNEFKIAEKLKMTVNQVRNLLYKLDAHDIVTFIRKKDKRKGWYIYYWSLDIVKSLKLLAKIKEKEIQQLSYALKSHENKRFFLCKQCDIELTEENALVHDFICPECGTLLQLKDNKEKILEIKKNIAKETRILHAVKSEISKWSLEEEQKAKRTIKKPKSKAKTKKHKPKKKIKSRKGKGAMEKHRSKKRKSKKR